MALMCNECPAAATWGSAELLCFGYAFTKPPTCGKPLPCNKLGKCVLGSKRVDELRKYYRDIGGQCKQGGSEKKMGGKRRAKKKLEELFAG